MKIVVLAGGLSPERDVSLSSGALIANALLAGGHQVLVMDAYLGLGGVQSFGAAHKKHSRPHYHYAVPEREPDLDALRAEGGTDALVGPGVLQICAGADVVFLALHGGMGEDGRLQAVFDSFGIRYTGTGYAGSLLAMDKELAKELMRLHRIPTPAAVTVQLDGAADVPRALRRAKAVDPPWVIKPCGCGSSVGVSMAESLDELERALLYAGQYGSRVLVEQKITGREFSAGILGRDALPVIEMIPKAGFYDYKNKYQPGFTEEVCPANLPAEAAAHIQRTALRVHAALRLGDYSRVDFILAENGALYCLEANTLPGMTPTSLLPREAEAAGIPYNMLCERIVALAMARP